MKKEEFLEILRSKLSILEESEINDIINDYSEIIEEKKKDKKKEEKIIEEFGNIDELAKEILKAYKISESYNGKNDFNDIIKKWFNKFEDVINVMVKKLSTASAVEILKFIIEMFVIFVLILIMKIPFEFINSILNDLFNFLPAPFDEFFNRLTRFIVEFSYVIISFLTFIVIFKERYLKESLTEKTIVVKKSKKEDISENTATKIVKVNKKEKSAFDTLTNIILIFVKIMLVFILLPFLFTFVLSVSGLIISIIFSFKYIFAIGIIITILGIVLGHIWLIKLFYSIIFNKEYKFANSFILFIISFILIGSGIGYTIIDFGSMNIRGIKEIGYDYKVYEETYNLDEILNENNVDFDISFSEYGLVDARIITDNTLGNNVKVQINYLEDFINIETERIDGFTDLYIRNEIKGKELFNFVINALKQKRIYDFTDIITKVRIYVSEANRNKIFK